MQPPETLDTYIRAVGAIDEVGREVLETRPENISEILEGLVADLRSRESISGVGLFGSRSRGDAVSSSDVDLLVVDRRDFDYEHVERAEIEDFLLDLDYIPEKWIRRMTPPEIDQKLYELQVLYERDGTLTKAKELMLKTYSTPERVEIRTGSHLLEADTYLSRGISALGKEDYQSAKVNAAIALEAVMKILIEVSRLPISNSRFIRTLESSTRKLGAQKLYSDYVEVAGLSKLDRQRVEGMLESFSAMWKEALSFIQANSSAVRTLHVKVMNDLNYYGRENFRKGMMARSGSLIRDGQPVEAAHYLSRTSICMLESYAWLLAKLDGTRFDYTTLFRYIKGSKRSPPEVHQKAAEALRIERVSEREAEESLRKTKEIALGVRQKRKELIHSLFS